MKIFKILLKSILAVVLLFILILMLIKVIGISYETRTQTINGADTKIEVKKYLGKKYQKQLLIQKDFIKTQRQAGLYLEKVG